MFDLAPTSKCNDYFLDAGGKMINVRPRGSVGSNEQVATSTFEKVKMLRITTNLNEIVSENSLD